MLKDRCTEAGPRRKRYADDNVSKQEGLSPVTKDSVVRGGSYEGGLSLQSSQDINM